MVFAKTDPLTKALEAVNKAIAGSDSALTSLVAAGLESLRATAAVRALALADRRGRTSWESHIKRELSRGGNVDLDKFERDMDERPGLFGCSIRALHTIEVKRILDGHYRLGTPAEESVLLRDVTEYSEREEMGLRDELSRSGRNVHHLVALGFVRAGRSHPELFGKLTWEAEAHEIAEALALIDKVGAQFRGAPVLM